MGNFRAYSAKSAIAGVPFYFIESTAPDSVEEGENRDRAAPPGLTEVDPDEAVKEIARYLVPENDPAAGSNLVVTRSPVVYP